MPVRRIDQDHTRFRQIVDGRIKRDLRKFVSSGELVGKQGDRFVTIPLPQIALPRFRHGSNQSQGVGQGEGQSGQPVPGQQGDQPGAGQAGEDAGEHELEVEVPIADLARILGEELELPAIEPRGRKQLRTDGQRYSGISRAGPNSLRHFKRTFREALKRQIASGQYDPDRPLVVPIREDMRFRAPKPTRQPEASAVVVYMMDVSGSMGGEQKEIVRIEAFWIDAWLRHQYRNLEVRYIVHDAEAHEVDQHSFFHLKESGGTKISSAYELLLEQLQSRWRPEDWNIYPFHYSDGDNWSARDTERCIALLRDEILPRCNQFCYGQVKSAYGSGQFKKDLDTSLAGEDKLVAVALDGREDVPDAIRSFLGRGR